jgi:site-specific recombinase XerD
MPSFRNAQKQAEHAVQKKLALHQARHTHRDDHHIHSLGTARNYTQALTRLTRWLQQHQLNDLKHLDRNTALTYMEWRGQSIGQKLLDQERQAIQLHLGIKLPVITSELQHALKSRAYTPEQIKLINQAQTDKYQLSTQLAYAAGLRAHELLTLQKVSHRIASAHRTWSTQRFAGREGQVYTVIGKGGLIREVLIPDTLAQHLEARRMDKPLLKSDRGIHYQQHYDLGGGKAWSNSFSAASHRQLGWSHGAHGVRHSYAQQRMVELQRLGFFYDQALGLVSQELGHFRPDITEVYLR